ncbi:MAG: thioredoxin domain-containing protein [Archangiaceae bacterium]|nr:thioredoxin domain-containing protein [Archangiaceae bacterium]
MHNPFSRSFVALAVTLCVACACDKGAKTGGAASGNTVTVADDPKLVVAKLNGRTITLGDLESAPGGEKLFEMEEQRYQTRRQVIDQLIFKELVGAEAKKKNQTEEQWMSDQIDSKVKPPTDKEIDEFYEKNKEGMPPGTTMEMVKPRIVDFMTRDQKGTLVRALFDDLKKQAGVEITLAAPKKPKKEVEAKGPSRGPEGAKVTIVEFSDFQCPFCSRAHDTVEEVMSAYAGKVRLVFRHFPLEFHAQAPKAAEAALCADEQKKFWEYHDVLFKNQQKLQVEDLKAHATALGLDGAKFNECLDSGRMAAVVKTDTEAGHKAGVSGTPAFFINGNVLSGAQPLEEFKRVIDAELATN